MNPHSLEQIGGYPVKRFIAEGGMSWVFEVEDTRFGVSRALKMLKPEAAAGEEFKRFEAEAKLLANLEHPNIITIYDFGKDEDTSCYFYTMTYVDGPALSKRGVLPVAEAGRIFVDILSGLAKLHDAGVTHRDIKPSNILITNDDRAVLIDMGIVRERSEPSTTKTGTAIGTVLYMSPEQARGQEVGPPSDVFSTGLSLYQVITGQSLYDTIPGVDASGSQDVLFFLGSLHHSGKELQIDYPAHVPMSVRGVIDRASRFKPEDRYPDARAMQRALEIALEPKPVSTREESTVMRTFGGRTVQEVVPQDAEEGAEARRTIAIFFSDIVGFTEKMGSDEVETMRVVRESRNLQRRVVGEFQGEWVKDIGDGAMCIFDSAVQAVNCGLEIQRNVADNPDFRLRIGIHAGDALIQRTATGIDVFGDAVNVAARIEGVADPGGVAVSERVYDDLRNRKGIHCRSMGEKQLKNVNRRIRVYAVSEGDGPAAAAVGERAGGRIPMLAAGAALVVLLSAGGFWWLSQSSSPESDALATTRTTAAPQAPVPETAQAPTPDTAQTSPAARALKQPPPDAAELLVAALRDQGIPFEGEADAPKPPDGFESARKALLERRGNWQDAGARVWTDPAPVADGNVYRVHFEANCDCSVLLFSVSSDEISLLYPNPYEPPSPIVAGESRQLPSSGSYQLRAVGGGSSDTLVLMVKRGEFSGPKGYPDSWYATADDENAIAELEGLFYGLDGAQWASASTELKIIR